MPVNQVFQKIFLCRRTIFYFLLKKIQNLMSAVMFCLFRKEIRRKEVICWVLLLKNEGKK